MFSSFLNAHILAREFACTSRDIVSSECNYENILWHPTVYTLYILLLHKLDTFYKVTFFVVQCTQKMCPQRGR